MKIALPAEHVLVARGQCRAARVRPHVEAERGEQHRGGEPHGRELAVAQRREARLGVPAPDGTWRRSTRSSGSGGRAHRTTQNIANGSPRTSGSTELAKNM